MAKKRSKKLSLTMRLIYISFGVLVASMLILFSFRWEDLPITINSAGIDITPYALAPILVLTGILASSLTKSALIGEKELDS